jgi:CDP-diacylglycerol---glycerol-3-phosphate 3-phosphatidyltransferase
MVARARLRALPNIISLSRVLLAAAFVAVRHTDARIVVVALAAMTDFLDGWVARHANSSSRWGALIDPLADRIFAVVAVSFFLITGALSVIGCLVMLSRDIMTLVGFIVARIVPWLRPVQFKARMSGKIVTTVQFLTFVALLAVASWVTPLLWVVAVTSAYSIVDYTLALWRARVR